MNQDLIGYEWEAAGVLHCVIESARWGAQYVIVKVWQSPVPYLTCRPAALVRQHKLRRET